VERLGTDHLGTLSHARDVLATWIEDDNTARPHSPLSYATPAAFAAIASHALMHDHNSRSLVTAG